MLLMKELELYLEPLVKDMLTFSILINPTTQQ